MTGRAPPSSIAGVPLLRALLLKNPMLVLAVGLAALALRLAVPAGFMPVLDQGRYVLAPCPAGGAMPGMAHSGPGEAQAQSSCAFADLSLPAIGGAGAVQLAAALVFVMIAALLRAAQSPPLAALRLRPPLRGPPRRR